MIDVASSADSVVPYARPSDLPDFDAPPVTEVAIALHFLAPNFRAVHLGLLWERLRDRYPVVEERSPMMSQVEQFGATHPPTVQFQFLDTPPVPLTVFADPTRESLVQVQQDRFQCSWRQGSPGHPYPRYSSLREEFVKNVAILDQFAAQQDIGELLVKQAEITFINAITDVDTVADVLRLTPAPVRDTTTELPEPDLTRVAQRRTFRTDDDVPYARLHMAAEPGLSPSGEVVQLVFTYRGEPFAGRRVVHPLASIMGFLDEGHDRIVRAFADTTTDAMHLIWRRTQ